MIILQIIYLKKEIFKARTGLYDVNDANASRQTLANEPFGSNSIILNKSILAEDISFNLTVNAHINSLFYDTTISDSSWNNTVYDQTKES